MIIVERAAQCIYQYFRGQPLIIWGGVGTYPRKLKSDLRDQSRHPIIFYIFSVTLGTMVFCQPTPQLCLSRKKTPLYYQGRGL